MVALSEALAIVVDVGAEMAGDVFVDSRSSGGKRSAAFGNTPDREGKDRGDKVKTLVGVHAVPALLAAVGPPQFAADASSSLGVELSMENIEIMFKCLLKNTNADM